MWMKVKAALDPQVIKMTLMTLNITMMLTITMMKMKVKAVLDPQVIVIDIDDLDDIDDIDDMDDFDYDIDDDDEIDDDGFESEMIVVWLCDNVSLQNLMNPGKVIFSQQWKENPSFVKEIAEIVYSSFWNCISFKPKLNLLVGQAKMQ